MQSRLDLNNNGSSQTNEPQASAVQRWASSQVSGIVASPSSSTGQVNTLHTVTGTVSPVANGVLVRFRVTQGPNLGDTGSAFTNGNGRASFSYLGNGGVGADLVLVWVDFDGDGAVDANEPQSAAIRTWTAVAASAFSLSPANDSNPVNTRHSMKATVAPARRGLLVRFEVTSGPNEGTRGSDETNSSGRADLSYVGDEGVGTDVILAWVDFDRDGRIDAGEPQAIATKQWTQLTVSGLTLSPQSDEERVGKKHKLTAQLAPKLKGVLVQFEVISGPNLGLREDDRTGGNGRASIHYRGNGGAGTDIVLAWADLDRDGVLDPGEPQATAPVVWQGVVDDHDADERVEQVCDNLGHYTHPALPTLCDLIENGHLPDAAAEAIADAILFKAGFGYWPRSWGEWPYESNWWSQKWGKWPDQSVWWQHDEHDHHDDDDDDDD